MSRKRIDAPFAQRQENLIKPETLKRGWLKHGNLPGDFSKAPRCGACAKRTGSPCQQPAMANGRCRLHGGKSTGPKTAEGLARAQKANWKHGEYSQEAKHLRKTLQQEFKAIMEALKQVREAL